MIDTYMQFSLAVWLCPGQKQLMQQVMNKQREQQ